MKHTPITACAGRTLRPALAALFLWAPMTLHATEFLSSQLLHQGCCGKHLAFQQLGRLTVEDSQGKTGSNAPKFAPDRLIDLRHLKLEITPHFESRSLDGVATLTFAPIAKPLDSLRLDAVDLDILQVTMSGPGIASHHVATDHLGFVFKKPIPTGKEITLVITYRATPEDAFLFRTEAMGYLPGDDHFWTQGEPQRHRHWFPSHDYPNERFTTEVICHVPEGMQVLSNGKLLSKKNDPRKALTSFHWLQDKPHVNYLISIAGGYFESLEDQFRNIPIGFFTVPSDFNEAANSFADTKAILAFYEKEIGVPYPWDKYYSVVVKDFLYGGMENTSVTTLTDRTLFSLDSENIQTSQGIDAHEIAHQWFGNLVTCKDWSHLWLNEGFATYYTQLYDEHKNGRDNLLFGMYRNAERVLNTKDERPIAWRQYKDPKEQFDQRAYPKGAWVLHMLRSQLGPDLYRQCIRTYLERNRFREVVTEDLNRSLEELSGRSFDRFFDQWVYRGGHPVLDVKYAWDGKSKKAKLTVTQKQKQDDKLPVFQLPLPVRFTTARATHDFTVDVSKPSQDFYFALPDQPKTVRVDPDYTLLAQIAINLPAPLLHAQLVNENDMMGRLFATRELGKKKDAASIAKLADRLTTDPFWGVRLVAAQQLGKVHTDAALKALIAGREQPDARARQAVTQAIGSYYRDDALDALRETIAQEKNPLIVTAALSSLGKFPREEVAPSILKGFARDSYRNHIAEASVTAMRAQDDPRYISPLFKKLQADPAAFTSRGLMQALDTVAYLSRADNSDDITRERVRRRIADYLDDPRDRVRVAAIKALGTLRDPRSIAILQGMPTEPASREDVKAAKEALETLRKEEAPGSQLSQVRKDLLDLQSRLKKLEKQAEDAAKKADPEKPEETPTEKKGKKQPGEKPGNAKTKSA